MSLSRSNDTASAVYFEVTLTANPGFELNMDNWSFDGAAGGGTAGQRTYEVHSSVAGLARDADIAPAPPTSLASGGFTTIRGAAGSTGPMQTITADLSSPAYDHLSALTMRASPMRRAGRPCPRFTGTQTRRLIRSATSCSTSVV